MRNPMAAAALAAALFLAPVLAIAQSFGTAAEAHAMLERAIAALKADKPAALAKFNQPDGGFRDRDLYVFCFVAKTGIRTAHVNQASVGQDLKLTTETDGSPLGTKIVDAANRVQDGEITTVTYNFPRPGTKNPVAKESYVTRVGDQGCGVGYYK